MVKVINKIFTIIGLRIERINKIESMQMTMKGALIRSFERGFLPKTIIDVGAAEGAWTLDTLKIWPSANFLLLEPLEERKKSFTKFE
jgi:hypothetical protein